MTEAGLVCPVEGRIIRKYGYCSRLETLGQLVEDICCNNAREYFGL